VRPRFLFIAVAVASALVFAACGGGGGGDKSTTTIASTTTTTPQPVANIEVRPAEGNVGTTFTLIGTGFKPGETVTFEVGFPDNRAPFKGAPHKTTPDGAVQTTYRATAGNPAGRYTVKAIGDQGTTGEGTFQLGGAGAASTATTVAGSGGAVSTTSP